MGVTNGCAALAVDDVTTKAIMSSTTIFLEEGEFRFIVRL